jgi:hypothetical protein
MTAQLTDQATQVPTTQQATTAGRGRLREVCHRVHLAVADMNDASRRAVEAQAPWSVDKQWDRR